MAEVLGLPGLPADVLRVAIVLLVLAAALPSGAGVFHVLRTAIQRPLDGRSGLRVSRKAGRIHARQWWGMDVPYMSEADFARTFRIPRAVFAMFPSGTALKLFIARKPAIRISPTYAMRLPLRQNSSPPVLTPLLLLAAVLTGLTGTKLTQHMALTSISRKASKPNAHLQNAQKFN